jgi:hypothetical protein
VTADSDLRGVIIGLLSFASAEEQILLATCDPAEPGNANRWAAVPLIAHNTEFKRQQVLRLEAIRSGQTPAEFGEIDHRSAQVYLGYLAEPANQVAAASMRVTDELIANLGLIDDADLTDPARHAWLRGRHLWLQLIVRGFWHPTGHLADYYLAHGQSDRAVALGTHGVLTASYLGAPDPARGMASYNLACAQAGANLIDDAAATLRQAIALNPDLVNNARRDQDLAAVTASGLLENLLAER